MGRNEKRSVAADVCVRTINKMPEYIRILL